MYSYSTCTNTNNIQTRTKALESIIKGTEVTFVSLPRKAIRHKSNPSLQLFALDMCLNNRQSRFKP